MGFGPHLEVSVPQKEGKALTVLLAPHTKEAMPTFVQRGGMQQHSVNRYLAPKRTVPVLEDELDWFEKTRAQGDSVVWAVWVESAGELKVIGGIGLESIEHGPSGFVQATDGIILFDQTYWRKGIASAIQKAVTWFAFTELGIGRIKAAVIQGNVGSLKALQGAGYSLVYVERNTAYVAGKLHHQDNLECVNPLEPFFSTWWGGDVETDEALGAREKVLAVFKWAEGHVRIL
jgi:RimJ/RimL family protein N-acetyltransferase